MPLTNKTKYAVLGILNCIPMSGYDIKKFSDGSIAHFWNDDYARIYPVLKELERDGLVTKVTAQSSPGRPPKNIYSITDGGKEELNKWLLLPVEDVRPREEILLKLFFGKKLPVDNIMDKLKAEKQKCQNYIEEYLGIEQCLKTGQATRDEPALPLWLATINYGKLYRQAIITWCDQTLASVEQVTRVPQELQAVK